MEGGQQAKGFVPAQYRTPVFQGVFHQADGQLAHRCLFIFERAGHLGQQFLVAVVGADVREQVDRTFRRAQRRNPGHAEDLARFQTGIVAQPAGEDGFVRGLAQFDHASRDFARLAHRQGREQAQHAIHVVVAKQGFQRAGIALRAGVAHQIHRVFA